VLNLVAHIEGETYVEGVENRVLRRIFGVKRFDVAGVWGKLRNELYDLYCSAHIFQVIK
jgi:hypothetical protein